MWTAEHVLMRFLEAADTDRRLPRVHGPKPPRSAKLEILHDSDFDANSQEGTRDKAAWAGFKLRTPPTGWAISRHDECLNWSLILDPKLSSALWLFCFARVDGRAAQKYWKRGGISNRTGYRRLEQGIRALVGYLTNNDVLLVPADLDRLAQIGLTPRHPDAASPIASSPSWRAPDAVYGDTIPDEVVTAGGIRLAAIPYPTRRSKRIKRRKKNPRH
ncbi:hypothetical protein [Bradyrhizobium sp. Leo121]|uniref:hypothetical protein n=1 Tax=Bradyrhizobium sp. Leo121 TaxID=1571195 RepID=UPI001029E52B|nr:hypothetical protein [Bradyrhizobium sp. Leo121]RZN30492.1 hypothetical protein CWO90_20360 [Bradyrhizobium sp. Leo121]